MNNEITKFINGLCVGDIERAKDLEWFFRIYYTEKAMLKLNKRLNSNFKKEEWITMVVNEDGKCTNVVAYSETDKTKYDLTNVLSKRIINKLLKQGLEFGFKKHIFVNEDIGLNEIFTPLGKCYYKILLDGNVKILDSDRVWFGTLLKNDLENKYNNKILTKIDYDNALKCLVKNSINENDITSVMCFGMEGFYYAKEIKGLVNIVNDRMDEYYPKYNESYSYVSESELKNNGLINRVGSNYYLVYGSGYGYIVD